MQNSSRSNKKGYEIKAISAQFADILKSKGYQIAQRIREKRHHESLSEGNEDDKK